MVAYLWDWMTVEQRGEAAKSAARHVLASVRMRAHDSLNGGPDVIWVDYGNGQWYCGAVLFPDDLKRGVRTGEKPE